MPATSPGWVNFERDTWVSLQSDTTLIDDARFALAQERLQRNQQWATRNTHSEYLLRRLLSCRWCGLAMNVWNNGRSAYYRCRGMDVLANRGRREPRHARQIPTSRIDDLVWDDLRQLLGEPAVLKDAVQRLRNGWLSSEERQAQRATCGADVPRSSAASSAWSTNTKQQC